jgi:cation diffusion facilitator family transporter
MASHRGSELVRAARLSLATGLLILALKAAAWYRTGSVAVLSDALESVVNVVAALLLLLSLRIATRPADRNHPYGHGKIEFFSAGVEGALIAIAALVIGVEAMRGLRGGADIVALEEGLALIVVASVLNGGVGLYLLRLGRRIGSLALEADGRHLLSDVLTSAAVIVGLAAVWLTGNSWIDSVVALAVAAHILVVGSRLVRRAIGGLMDEADLALLQRISKCFEAGREPWWIDVHSLRVWRSGPFLHGDLHLVVPRFFDADRLHQVGDEVEAAFLGGSEGPGEAIVHFDPCRPRHCPHCPLPECPVRHAPQHDLFALTVERVTREDESLDVGVPLSQVTGQ